MDTNKAKKILKNDPVIQETLERAEAMQKAIDALDGLSDDTEYERGYTDGKADCRLHFGWKDPDVYSPKTDQEVVVKTSDGKYLIAKMIMLFKSSGNYATPEPSWVTMNGTEIYNVKNWKLIEDDLS